MLWWPSAPPTVPASPPAVCATDRAGLAARRLRLHHLWDSPALAHEADVVVLLNDRWATDPAMTTGTARKTTVFNIAKNLTGPAGIDLEFTTDFANFRFEPQGQFAREEPVDDIVVLAD